MKIMDPKEILQKIPHSFPFRMIDQILEIEPGKKAIAVKKVSMDEPFFQGHFPNAPLMPGVLMVEALAQIAGMAFLSTFADEEEGVPFLARVDKFRFKKKVFPGDQMILEAEIIRIFSNLAKVKVLAIVEGETVAEGILVLAKGLPVL
jgi:3-hydroxyacyl-[acyl-carrier-protein] dehydratase